MTSRFTVVIVGGGPVGLALALLLARRQIHSEVLDARTLDAARADRRLLALSRGSIELLEPLATLPPAATAPIRTVVVSSAGEFGRVEIGAGELGPRPLGLTVRYGELLAPLADACAGNPFIQVTRPLRVAEICQHSKHVVARLDNGTELEAPILVNAEGTVGTLSGEPAQVGLVADVVVQGPESGSAYERFTRDGPLALLPSPGAPSGAGRAMAMVWCMPPDVAARRLALDDEAFAQEIQQAFGARNGRILHLGPRASYPLHQQSRTALREHRVVFVGNAAQTLHPVAGQGLNLGMRDVAQLAEHLARAHAERRDPVTALADYERVRRVDRTAILALTRNAPQLFATRAAPIAIGRSVALAALSAVPTLRQQFARLLMFGVRA
jgi:2-octaprenyl-6-methoxyphenol hydroxylase